MLSPSVSVTAPPPDNSSPATTTNPTTRRRGLSYLRNLSQGRSGAVSPGETGRSARSYFQRTIGSNDKNNSSSSLPPPHVRLQSPNRPNEPTSPVDEPTSPIVLSTPGSPVEHTKSPRQEPSVQGGDNTTTQFPPLEGSQISGGGSSITSNGTVDVMARTNSRRNTSSSQRPVVGAAVVNGDTPSLQPPTTNAGGAPPSRDGQEAETKQQLPMIRFISHQEIRNGRQSLNFGPISRTLPNENAIIRVGRYSEREGVPPTNPNVPSDAPVGFKSKVVSRKHCEFSFSDGQWHLKDVASSSGTFLNHIRLSQPNTESKLFPIKDGDIIQLGIDFRGGEEMIFRCVKIRVECNRSWQKKPNTFNKSRHAQLQSLAKEQAAATGNNSGECSICLGSVMPCQALFVAPCAHVWHYKCIRPLLDGNTSTYPQFQCPNCRAYFDLSADVDVVESDTEDFKDTKGESSAHEDAPESTTHSEVGPTIPEAHEQTNGNRTSASEPVPDPIIPQSESAALLPSSSLNASGLLARRQANNPSSSEIQSVTSLNMPNKTDGSDDRNIDTVMTTRAETPDREPVMAGEGPLTPMNNIGPFVFDGSAGRDGNRRVGNIFEVTEGH